MKTIGFIFLLMMLSNSIMAQEHNTTIKNSDTLVWSIYIAGKSDMSSKPFAEEVAIQWGIKLVYFFGDCTGTYDYKSAEFDESNNAVFDYLTKKFGQDWRTKFDEEVATLQKKSTK